MRVKMSSQDEKMWKTVWKFTILVVLIIALPLILIVDTPTTDSFDRQNVYTTDGYRDAGYYAVRHNPTINGFVNITHPGGTNIVYIETNNIQNVTLSLETMYSNRNFLFGWIDISWLDAVKSVNEIVLYINTTDGIDEFQFTDYPGTWFKVTVDGSELYDWTRAYPNERTEVGLTAGNHIVTLDLMRAPVTLYDIFVELFEVIIMLAVVYFIMQIMKSAMGSTKGGGK